MQLVVLALLTYVLCCGVDASKQKTKSVTTLIEAKWEVTPLVLEISEYLGDENADFLWEFLDAISALHPSLAELESDRERYEKALDVAGQLRTPAQISVLKLALSLHIYSPKVEMYSQMAIERGVAALGCPIAADVGGKLTCCVEELKKFITQTQGTDFSRVETFGLDHHYPGSQNNSITVVLYGELGTPEFAEFHYILKTYAVKGDIDYVLRHYIKERPNKRVRLSGYGVELQIKSTEYKVQDDTQVKGDKTQDSSEQDDEDDEIEGFNFSRLKTRGEESSVQFLVSSEASFETGVQLECVRNCGNVLARAAYLEPLVRVQWTAVGGPEFEVQQLYPDKKGDLDKLRLHLLESSNEMAPLKVWQVQELSLQAAERIMSSPKEEALKVLTNIAQNFPLQARSLVRTVVKDELKQEIKRNQEMFSSSLNLQPTDTALFVNGMFFDLDVVDVISLLEVVRQELRVMEGLHKIGISDSHMSSLLALDFSSGSGSSSSPEYAIDIRDSAVMWVNDIEHDKQYRRWSDSLMELLRPTFPGMLRSVRRNLYNLVILANPAKKEARPLLKLAESFYVHTAPLRIGLVFAVNSDQSVSGKMDAGVAMLNAFNYVSDVKDAYHGLAFITDVYATIKEDRDVTVEDVMSLLNVKYRSADVEEIFGEDSEYDTGRRLARDFVERSGFRKMPQALLNGIPISEKHLNGEDFEEAVLSEIMNQTPVFQKAVYKGDFTDGDNALDYIMNQPNVMPRLNDRVLNQDKSQYLDMSGSALSEEIPLTLKSFSNLSPRDKTATVISRGVQYFMKKQQSESTPHIVTHWIVTDLGTAEGRQLLTHALDQMRSSGSIRVGVLLNPSSTGNFQQLDRYILAAPKVLQPGHANQFMNKILSDDNLVNAINSEGGKDPKEIYMSGVDLTGLSEALQEDTSEILRIQQTYCQQVLNIPPGGRAIVTNGRVLGPLEDSEKFTLDDFSLLERYSMNSYGDKILQTLKKKRLDDDDDDDDSDEALKNSDVLMQAMALVVSRPQSRSRFEIPVHSDIHSVVKLPPHNISEPAFDIAVIVDPVSRGAQRVGPILSVLQEVLNCHIKVYLNCVEKNSDMPLKSFYRFVLEPEIHFTSDGRQTSGPMARFANMPTSPLLTQNMQVPENWLVESVRSPYDLDNIRLEDVDSVVHSATRIQTRIWTRTACKQSSLQWYQQFKDTGCMCKGKSTGRPTVERVRESFVHSPQKSTAHGSRKIGIPQQTVEELKFKPYRLQLLQHLKAEDYGRHLQFCTTMQEAMEDEDFTSKLIFSDECTFHLSGVVNLHNTKMYGPFFSCENTYGYILPRYVDFVFVSTTNRRFRQFCLPTNGAPPHWMLAVSEYLNHELPNRWIGRIGADDQALFPWPTRSPDLTPCDFYLWGYIKDRVYVPPLPQTLVQLRERISNAVMAIDWTILHNVEFELEYLLLEGHCFEATMGNPPRGLQITLGTETQPVVVDTIVMANLGYFQLKANPGAWLLRLRQGRSADIFDIVSHDGSDTPANSTDIKVLISSFRSHVLKLKVAKKPDKMHMDLLSDDSDPNSGIWNSITSTFGGSKTNEEDGEEKLNIFSLASGHLYERFLRIMMLSVLKNTNTPVKFWFLKNYLSPTFKDFLPHMAKDYGFEYELVQYKWPRWLHQQTEKQRIIWGYKILFLDVLFPLDVKKIIFVDADQVVRADMKELRDLDLGGAPYGYTPFCDSRTEMDGFRFWKQGYWRNHLQGRRYHISALYIVDLRRFRRIAAGDRLRGQYQALSQDPNSLSNLDQDLPNNMIHQVAIKSLPQEWLWCETWCDDASKQYAKTIDLCNNPLTKEAKLTAAMRIVSEWKDYDLEIKNLQNKIDRNEIREESSSKQERNTEWKADDHEAHSEL
ncbi:hypothetical protein ANN_14009 [Periplaneta americana]|uniref:UDP-glucose:glycoprotein glucosyltransferase n=1 Tax=Periplaneta americana TaxID=6978 RepID=A0ABQ8SV44_PERAM|nr:hypothetical protein ANN_14009 [Periplaneta americana]